MIPIARHEIHLWLADYESIAPATLDRLTASLEAHELAQQRRFYFARDRCRYLVTRALVRSVLSRYLPIAPEAWRFSKNAYGRPAIANPEAAGSHLLFNLSHTHSLVALGVTRDRQLGIDVENIASRSGSLDLARHFFAPGEADALATVPQSQLQYRFFEYWTFKESYIKARGMGLSIPLDKFSYSFPAPDAVAIDISDELGDAPARWQFWQVRPGKDYLLALCAERMAAPTVLVPRMVTPDFCDMPVELPVIRRG
jgi:4'-phosphopantetheinyl transferase